MSNEVKLESEKQVRTEMIKNSREIDEKERKLSLCIKISESELALKVEQ